MLPSLTGTSTNQSYPAAAAAQSGFAAHSPVQSKQSNLLNFGLLALVAMYLSTLLWSIAGDARPPPMGNDRNFYRMALVMSAGIVASFALLRNPKLWPQAFPAPLLMLLFYGLLAMISSSFIPEYAFYSLWKSLEIVVVVLAAAAILSHGSSREGTLAPYHAILVLFALLVVAFAVEALLLPAQALHPSRGFLRIQLRGALPVTAENAVAFLSAVVAFAGFVRLIRSPSWWQKVLYALLFAVASVVLVLAQSRTSLIGFCLAVPVYLWFDRRFALLAGLAGLVLIAGLYASFFDVFSQYLLRGQDAELVTSLSGRTSGWEQAWREFQDAPVLGHGYAAYARAHILGLGGATSMHGAVFEVMVGTGGLGLLLWGGGIIWTLIRLYRLPASGDRWFQTPTGRSVQAEMLGLAVLILLRATTSSGLAENDDNLILFLSLLAYTELTRRFSRIGYRTLSDFLHPGQDKQGSAKLWEKLE
jgi:O-antigen ligase